MKNRSKHPRVHPVCFFNDIRTRGIDGKGAPDKILQLPVELFPSAEIAAYCHSDELAPYIPSGAILFMKESPEEIVSKMIYYVETERLHAVMIAEETDVWGVYRLRTYDHEKEPVYILSSEIRVKYLVVGSCKDVSALAPYGMNE